MGELSQQAEERRILAMLLPTEPAAMAATTESVQTDVPEAKPTVEMPITSTGVSTPETPPVTFLDRAKIALHYGIPVVPALPRQKATIIGSKEATTDLSTIEKWNQDNPNYNSCLVAQEKIGGVWILDCDSREVKEQIEKETGKKLPDTFSVQSSSAGHRYFRQNEESLKRLRNFSVHRGDKEFFSVRFDNMYCVGPLSVHPSGAIYKVVKDVEPVEAPSWLLDWLLAQGEETKLPVTASLDGPKIPRGSHDVELTRVAGKLRGAGMEEESITEALIEICEKRCENFGSDYREMCQKIAHSICKHPAGDSSIPMVYHGPTQGIADMPSAQANGGNAMPVIDDQPTVASEPYPEFPEMSGALWNLAREMFPELPMSLKFMALVTNWGLVRSGLDIFAGQRNLQTRFYTCLITEPWRGKTAAMNEAHNYLLAIYPPVLLYADSVDSAPALVDDFEDLRKAHPSADRLLILLHADEMVELFEKAKTTAQSRNTLGSAYLNLFESNTVSNRARQANKGKRIQIENAHFAILGGTTIEGYAQMWQKTGGGANGLMSRFIPIGTNAGMMPSTLRESTADAAKYLRQIIELSQKPKQTVYLEGEADRILSDWWMPYRKANPPNPSVVRVLDIVKRMILVLAVTNPSEDDLLGDDNCIRVEPSLVRQACAFGDYIITMRDRLNPADSYSAVQSFENAIIGEFEKHPDETRTKPVIMSRLNVNRTPGGIGAFVKAWDNVIRHTDKVKQVGVSRKGEAVYQKNAEAA